MVSRRRDDLHVKWFTKSSTPLATGATDAFKMASKPQKRDIASFFKPSAHSIPAKRPSPSLEDEEVHHVPTKSNQTDIRTPKSAARFKNVTPSSCWSPIGPGSGSSVKIPIRSPRPKPPLEPVTSFSSRLSAHYKDSPIQKWRDHAQSPQPTPQSISFTNLPSSTQSVVKDGKIVAVRGSDDEDSDSLSSLDDILGRRKSETATSSSSPPDLDADEREAERLRTMFRFTGGRSQPLIGREKLRELNSRERDHKVDIGVLMGDHFDDQEIEGNIAKAKQGYEASKQEEEYLGGPGDVDRHLLAAVVAGVPGAHDDMSRLMCAVERTEALNLERSWSFFAPRGPKCSPAEQSEIAVNAQLSDWWQESLQDNDSRSRTFLSGFMAETWSHGLLPEELIQWTFDNIAQEPSFELRRSYVKAFKHAKPEWVRNHLRPSTIQRMFLRIGASQQALSSGELIEPAAYVSRSHKAPDYRYLLSLVEVLLIMAPQMEISAHRKFLTILARVALDAQVMGDARASVAVEDGLSVLIELLRKKDSPAIASSFLADLATCLTDPVLQAQLLKHIPCTSSITARVRLQLAHHFLLGAELHPPTDLSSLPVEIAWLTRYLDSGSFNTSFRSPNKRPDYTNMTALTYLLDVAIADGCRPASFDSLADEAAFNRNIDNLADRIKAIFASIADTGASHMRRTEAKEALQALHYRLLYAVRTEVRPKKNVFGGRDGDEYRAEERSQGFMSKFLARNKSKNSSQGPGREWVPNDSSQASKSESEELIRRQLQLDM